HGAARSGGRTGTAVAEDSGPLPYSAGPWRIAAWPDPRIAARSAEPGVGIFGFSPTTPLSGGVVHILAGFSRQLAADFTAGGGPGSIHDHLGGTAGALFYPGLATGRRIRARRNCLSARRNRSCRHSRAPARAQADCHSPGRRKSG